MEESKKTKGHAEDCQNRLRPPMSEESKINKGPEEDSQNRLRPPISDGGEKDNQRA